MTPNPKMPCRDLNELYPFLKHLAELLIIECKKQGISIVITQTFRSPSYQQSLYNQGRTTKGNIITNSKAHCSMHEYRLAFDVCINIKGKNYDTTLLNKVGAIGRKLGLIWGGDWDNDGNSKDESFIDMPHFQWTGGLGIHDLQKGLIPKFPPIPQPNPTPQPKPKPYVPFNT